MATLEYAKAGTRRPLPRWVYWVAMGLFGWPTVAGVGITLLYLVTWWDRLPWLGGLCIFGGIWSLAGGAAFLLVYWWRGRECGERSLNLRNRDLNKGMLLALANFPIAAGCIWLAMSAMGQLQVRFINNTNVPITNVVLLNDGKRISIGDLPPGARRTHMMRPRNETSVTGTAVVGGVPAGFEVEGYFEGTLRSESKTVQFVGPTTAPVVR
jgi:hypothetical protein